jgi:hypothetical protein
MVLNFFGCLEKNKCMYSMFASVKTVTKSEDCSESRIIISVPGFPPVIGLTFGATPPHLPILMHQQLEQGMNGKIPCFLKRRLIWLQKPSPFSAHRKFLTPLLVFLFPT